MNTKKLSETPIWKKLKAHAVEINRPENHLKFLLEDQNRLKNFSLNRIDFLYDYSRQRVTEETMDLLFELAEVRNVKEKFDVNLLTCVCAIDKATLPPLLDYFVGDVEVDQSVTDVVDRLVEVDLFDVHVEGVEQCLADRMIHPVQDFHQLLCCVDETGLETIQGFDAQHNPAIGGIISQLAQLLRKHLHITFALFGGRLPGPTQRRIEWPAQVCRAQSMRGIDAVPHVGPAVLPDLLVRVYQVAIRSQNRHQAYTQSMVFHHRAGTRIVVAAGRFDGGLHQIEAHIGYLGRNLRQPLGGQRRQPHPGIHSKLHN